tara:strand:- start:1165 stop:2490 length:1326 start_codon:yes stop_codon:yes gene_type:complete
MSKLLKEAIADAKAVRETALANARLALEEAFAPRLQSMLTKKLREEEAELDGVEDEVEVSDEVEEGSYSEDDAEVEEPSAEDEVEEGSYLEDDEESEEEVADVDAEVEAPAEDSVEDELEVEDEEEDEEDLEEDSFDLDSIIAELESELTTEEEEGEEEESEEEDTEAVEEQSSSSELGIKGEEHVNVADSDDEELPAETETVAGDPGTEDSEMPKVADIDEEIDIEIVEESEESEEEEAEEDEEESVEESVEEAEGCNQGGDIGEDDEEINLEEILKELEDESSLEDETESTSEVEEMKAINTKLQKENEEYRKVYKYLRGKLNEVNLLNAKLLYTNKLFKQYGLNEDQKLKVVESFDLTKNVREAKLVYATLGESFRTTDTKTQPKVKEEATPKAPKAVKKSLSEGMASKAIKSTKPSKQILTEGDQLANRFKKLAGIV